VILGFLTHLAPSLEAGGYGAPVSGLAVGLLGLATLVWIRVANHVAQRIGKPALILVGEALLAAGYAAGAASQRFAGISLSAFLVGGGFALMHPTLQNWPPRSSPRPEQS
jgi:small neutral amino acid transporter SnatA (MarC family)